MKCGNERKAKALMSSAGRAKICNLRYLKWIKAFRVEDFAERKI